MIDFKCRPIYEVRIFSVSENGENGLGLGDEGADGDNALENFWARTAPGQPAFSRSGLAHLLT